MSEAMRHGYREAARHAYRTLLEQGWVYHQVGVGPYYWATADFRKLEPVQVWREHIRAQARLDRIRIRTIACPYKDAVLAVRLDWQPDDETRAQILRETDVHVCPSDLAPTKLQFVQTPYCGYCGEYVQLEVV